MTVMREAIDTTTLGWIKPELDETLRQAREEIETFAENPGDTARMRACASHLHQVHGTLRMIELYAPAMVAEEMERVAVALQQGKAPDRDEACAALMRGVVQLPDYLERLQGGHRDIPIVLLPLLNELRATRGEPGLSESVLFSPDLDRPLPGHVGPAPSASTTPRAPARAVVAPQLASLRAALAAWPEDGVPANPGALAEAIDSLLADAELEPLRRMLWVASSVAGAVRDGALPPTKALRQAFAGVERETRQLLEDEGFGAARVEPTAEPTRQLLYHVAHSDGRHEALDNLRQTFQLDAQVPSESEIAHARGSLSGRNRALLDTVAAAIKEDLLRVKDALDLHLRTGQTDASQLRPQVEALTRVGDTLGMMDLGVARGVVVQQRDAMAEVVSGRRPADETALLDIAGALLYVDASLDDQVARLGLPDGKGDDDLLAGESRKVLDVVVREAIANFGDARQSFVAFVETGWDHGELVEVPRLLDEVAGALRMLNVPLPAQYLAAVQRYTERELIERRRVPNGQQLDTLADALASLEYYLEALRDQRPNRDDILEIARQSLERLRYWPLPDETPAHPAGEAAGTPTAFRISDEQDAEIAAALEPLLYPDAIASPPAAPQGAVDAAGVEPASATEIGTEIGTPVEDATNQAAAIEAAAIEPAADEPAIEPAALAVADQISEHPVAAAAPLAETPVATEPEPEPVAEVGGFEHNDDIDDEIREVFLEELDEEIANLGQLLPVWRALPDDAERLRPIRRVFHTLKGSGRLVGAKTLGEYSWKVENMLNRVLDSTRPATPAVIALVEQAYQTLPQLYAALHGSGRITADLEGMQAVADRLAAGEEAVYVAAEVAPAEPAAASEAAIETQSEAGETGVVAVADVEQALADDASAPVTESSPEAELDAVGTHDVAPEAVEASPEPQAAPEPSVPASVDPVLLEILGAEVNGHLATIELWLANAALAPAAPDDALQRAVHTLNGAFAMTEVPVITDITGPSETYIKRLFAAGLAPTPAGLATLGEVATAIRRTLSTLESDAPRVPLFAGLADRLVALRDSLPAVRMTMPLDVGFDGEGDVEGDVELETAAGPHPDLASFDLSAYTDLAGGVPDLAPHQVEAERAEAARIEAERLDVDRVEAERLEAGNLDAERVEAERAEIARLDAERAEAEHLEAERLESERAEAERIEAERHEAERHEAARFEAERIDAERAEAARIEAERLEAERAEAERAEVERHEAARIEAERIEAERIEAERAEAARIDAERAEAERVEAERLQVERAEVERLEAERLEAERVAAEEEAEYARLELEYAAEAEAARARSVESQVAAAPTEAAEPAATEVADAALEAEAVSAVDVDEAVDATVQDAGEHLPAEPVLIEEAALSQVETETETAVETEVEVEAETEAETEAEAEPARAAALALAQAEADARAQLEAEAEAQAQEEADQLAAADAQAAAEAQAAAQAQADAQSAQLAATETVPAPSSLAEPALAELLDRVLPVVQDPDEALDLAGLDPELVDIFVEEGVDLLDHSDGLLAKLREAPGEREPLIGLQRDLHTLKGGARMAGIMAVGELGHVMESLLESVVENRCELGRDGVPLLERGFDRLHAMITRVGERRAIAMPELLIAEFDARSRGQTLISLDAVAATETATVSAPKVELKPLSAPIGEAPLLEDEDIGVRAPQEQVRIRADLLDRLVNYAGEVAIYRARLEQQLGAFRTAIGEMAATNDRVRDQLRRLEIETEAQIIARYQREHETGDATFDPLELDRFSNLQQLSRALAESAADQTSLQVTLDDLTRQYETLLLQQSRVSSELQEGLMRTRMVPFDGLLPRLRRVIRQASGELGKQVQLKLEGAQGELDRNVLERMTAPLEHMLRNSVAHGLETPAKRREAGKPDEGTIHLAVRREGSEVVLQVGDDGRGLDRDAIRRRGIERGLVREDAVLSNAELDMLIFEPGFSTADEVSRLAGRGVGMDVVASEVRQLGGTLDIQSTPGKGVTFTLRLPQTLAVTQAVFVRIGETSFAVPIASVRGVSRIAREDLAGVDGADPVYRYGGEDYAVHDLGTLLGHAPAKAEGLLQMPVLLIRAGDLRAAVTVDQVIGNREIVVKPVGPQVASVPGIFGATIMGDGRVVVILDVAPLVRRQAALPRDHVAAPVVVQEQRPVPLVMVVDDSVTMRKVTGRVLERHNFEVLTAKDGIDALERMAERVPDLMLLDIEMPRMDGYELATAMKAEPRLRDVPIVMITSRTGDKHRQRAFEIGVNRYLGKPYQEPELMRNVHELLGIARDHE